MSDHVFRAITTRYKGYNFRSRLEARWAVFFDHLGIRWDYEPEGFELGNGLRYLPDFWLPDANLWIEVKPSAPDPAAHEKASRLAQSSGFAVFMTHGMPDCSGTLFISRTRYGEDAGCVGFPARGGWLKGKGGNAIPFFVNLPNEQNGWINNDQGVLVWSSSFSPRKSGIEVGTPTNAIRAARSARFEFGQEGA